MTTRLLILAAALWCSMLSYIRGGMYYVSTNGGSGSGMLGDPWSLAHMISTVAQSNTVVFLPGDYAPFCVLQPWLTFTSQVKWAARVVARPQHVIGVNVWYANFTLDGFVIVGAKGQGIQVGADNTTIRNCWVFNNGTNSGDCGIVAKHRAGTVVEDNLVEFNGGGVCVDGTNATVRRNVIRDNKP